MAQGTTDDDVCDPTAEQGTRSHHGWFQELRHAVWTLSGLHTKAAGARSHVHEHGPCDRVCDVEGHGVMQNYGS